MAAANVFVARRPTVVSFVLSGFAYIAHVRGDEERAQEINSMIVPSHGEQLWNWCVLKPLGATAENFDQVRAAYENEHPIAERFALDAATQPPTLDRRARPLVVTRCYTATRSAGTSIMLDVAVRGPWPRRRGFSAELDPRLRGRCCDSRHAGCVGRPNRSGRPSGEA